MCNNSKCCQRPEKLKRKPKDCSAEQVEKCHGDQKPHPCCPNPTKDEDME